MKKKILSIILAIFMFAPCMFMLTACGSGSNGHTHEWSATYTKDASQHWKKCTGCDETTEKENHTFNIDTCTVCGYVDNNRTPAQKGVMSNYFSGVKATYTKENFLDSNNQAREFKDLVDRQIDVLAQDILARLDYVYGQHRTQPGSYVWGYAFPLYDLTGNEEDKIYKYYSDSTKDGLTALADSSNMLSQLSKEYLDTINDGTATLAEVSVDDLSDYQKSLLIKDSNNNCLNNTYAMSLINAANGGAMSIYDNGYDKILQDDSSKKWLVSDLTSKDAKDALKLMIVQELTGKESVNYDYLIGKIDTLGYKPDFSENLIKIINNKIIGTDRITEDNGYYDIIKNKYEGKITSDNVKSMNTSSDYSETNSPRLYKGYKVIVKQLVESALGNKFYNTQVSLYPKFSKKAVNYTSNANGFSEAHAYDTITLLAKANTLYTKLVVKIKGSDITESATLEYQVVVNGEAVGTKQNITLTNDSQELEISIAKTGTFGDFDGTTDVDTNNKIFENVQVDDRNTSNYITIEFTNASGIKFVVTFDGYYNK